MYLVIMRPSERACLHNPPSPPQRSIALSPLDLQYYVSRDYTIESRNGETAIDRPEILNFSLRFSLRS